MNYKKSRNSNKENVGDNKNKEEDILQIFVDQLRFKSPVEIDLQMHINKFLYIFEKAVYKIKLACCLPNFVKCKGKRLKVYLPPAEVEQILNVYDKYDESKIKQLDIAPVAPTDDDMSFTSSSSSNEEVIGVLLKDLRTKLLNGASVDMKDSDLDVDLAQTIDLLFFCEPIRMLVDKCSGSLDMKGKLLIEILTMLKDAANRCLLLTAENNRIYDENLRKAYKDNKSAVIEIEKLKDILNKQRQELGSQIKERNDQIKKCLNEIEALRENNKRSIKQLVKKSEKTMMQSTAVSEAKQAILSEQAAYAQENYKKLLESHLDEESILRIKEDKIEVSLSQWLAKYDGDIGDKQNIKEEIQAEYDADAAELERINGQIDEQESLFDALMAEKEREEAAANESIAEEYLRNRAARIVQKAWKDYKFRKWMKKMARKAKKEKKLRRADTVNETAPIEIDTAALMDDLPPMTSTE